MGCRLSITRIDRKKVIRAPLDVLERVGMGVFGFFKPNAGNMEKKRDIEGPMRALKHDDKVDAWAEERC